MVKVSGRVTVAGLQWQGYSGRVTDGGVNIG